MYRFKHKSRPKIFLNFFGFALIGISTVRYTYSYQCKINSKIRKLSLKGPKNILIVNNIQIDVKIFLSFVKNLYIENMLGVDMKAFWRDTCPAMSRYVPPCPAIGRDSWQDRGAGQKSRTPRPAIGRDKAGHSRTSPVPPCGGTTAEDVFMYCPALWRDKLSVHYLLGRFFFNRAVLAKTLRLACIVEGPRWGSPISCLVFCRVGPPKRKRPKEVNW